MSTHPYDDRPDSPTFRPWKHQPPIATANKYLAPIATTNNYLANTYVGDFPSGAYPVYTWPNTGITYTSCHHWIVTCRCGEFIAACGCLPPASVEPTRIDRCAACANRPPAMTPDEV